MIWDTVHLRMQVLNGEDAAFGDKQGGADRKIGVPARVVSRASARETPYCARNDGL
jgi:hypothetical protein